MNLGSVRLLLAVLALAAPSCFPGGAFLGEPVPEGEDPTELQPVPPEVSVEVLSIGLDGHVAAPERPTVAHLALSNRGPARRVILSFEEVVQESSPGLRAVMRDRVAPLEVALGAGEERELSWAVPVFNEGLSILAPKDGGLYAVARDESGRILGAGRAPRTQTYGMPIAVLAETDEAAIAIQNRILRAATVNERPPIALITGSPPTRFWEYEAAPTVVLAKPLSSLSPSGKTALRRFVAFGGRLVVPPGPNGQAFEIEGIEQGAGEIVLIGGESGPGGVDPDDQWRSVVVGRRNQVGLAEVSLPLRMRMDLPGTGALLGMIGLIVVLVGPVLHIVLARLRRREWAWLGVPALSVLLAVGMYALASGSKGAANGLEIQHLHVSVGDAPDAVVMTQVRLQSKAAATKTVRLIGPPGSDPRHDDLQRFLYGGGVFAAPAVRMEEDAVEVGPMAMHRWSSQDLAFASAGTGIPLKILAVGDGVRIENTSGLELMEVELYTLEGWRSIASSLAPGAVLELNELPDPMADPMADPRGLSGEAWAAAFARSTILSTASNVPRAVKTAELRILARCAARDLPRIEVRPAPDEVHEETRCLWIAPVGPTDGDAP